MKNIDSLRAYMKKEFIEGVRTHRFLILAAGVLFFAIANPVLLKLMPEILKSQAQGMDLTSIIELNQKAAMESYTKNLYQISVIVIVFTLMNLISGERMDKTLTIPVAMGCSIKSILISKVSIYGVYIMILSIIGMITAYYYSGIIFEPDYSCFAAVFNAGFLYGIFFIFVISLLLLLGSIMKKSFIAGISTLLIIYLMPLLDTVLGVGRYLPTNLLKEANYFNKILSTDLKVTTLFTVLIIILINTVCAIKLQNTELA